MKGGELSAERFALSAAVGLFVGAQPYYGAHIILCSLICIPSRLNSLIAYLVAWYSIPPLMPLLLYVSLVLGHRLMTGQELALTLETFSPSDLLSVTHELVIGAGALGLAMALAFTPPIYIFARIFKQKKAVLKRATSREVYDIFELYREQKKKDRYAVLSHLRVHPIVESLLQLLQQKGSAPRRVLVLNSARGQLCFLLARFGLGSEIVGIESDRRRLQSALSALEKWPAAMTQWPLKQEVALSFVRSESPELKLMQQDCILVAEDDAVLTSEEQILMIKKYAHLLASGGQLLLLARPYGLLARLLGLSRARHSSFAAQAAQGPTRLEQEPWVRALKGEGYEVQRPSVEFQKGIALIVTKEK